MNRFESVKRPRIERASASSPFSIGIARELGPRHGVVLAQPDAVLAGRLILGTGVREREECCPEMLAGCPLGEPVALAVGMQNALGRHESPIDAYPMGFVCRPLDGCLRSRAIDLQVYTALAAVCCSALPVGRVEVRAAPSV